jgi:hypothetical protein
MIILLDPLVNTIKKDPIPRPFNLLFIEDLQDTQRKGDIVDIRPNERTEQNVTYDGKKAGLRGGEFNFLSFLDQTPKIVNEEAPIGNSIKHNRVEIVEAIKCLNNIEYASSLVLDCLNSSNGYSFQDKACILASLLQTYDPNEARQNPDFAQYDIKIGRGLCYYRFHSQDNVTPLLKKIPKPAPLLMFKAQNIAFITCFNNKNYKLANNIAKDILKSAHNLLDQQENSESNYQDITTNLLIIGNQFLTADCAQKVKSYFHLHFMKNFAFISFESTNLLAENKDEELLKQFEQIISNEKEQYDNLHLAACRYNIGLACNRLGKHDKALEFLEAAHKYKDYTKDIEVIFQLVISYYALGKNKSGQRFINGIKDNSIKTFFQLIINPKLCSKSQIKKITSSQVPPNLQKYLTYFNIVEQLNRPNKDEQLISKVKEDINKLAKTDKKFAWAIASDTKLDDLATQIAKSITAEEAAEDPELQKIKLTHDTIGLEEIKNSTFDKAEMYEAAATGAICNNDLDAAKLAIEKGLALDPANKDLAAIAVDIAQLSSSASVIDQPQDLPKSDTIYVEPDHKAEHQYHQLRKKQIIQKALANSLPLSPSTVDEDKEEDQEWQIGKLTIKRSDVIYLGKYRHLDCYGYIPEKMQRKADGLLDKFIEALGKGIISRNQDQAGVKIIPNGCFEIKIFENDRLYTNELHFNGKKLLVAFNRFGNHDNVGDLAKKLNLHLVNASTTKATTTK